MQSEIATVADAKPLSDLVNAAYRGAGGRRGWTHEAELISGERVRSRDVAAMIRSFDYAAVAAVWQLAESRPAAEPRMVELAEAWRQRAVDGFRAAYRRSMRGCASYPASKKQAREMTAFFTLERTVHELSYELANRPDWAEIPLKGILATLAQARSNENFASDESLLE